jgi:putative membrane protein
MPLKIRGKVEAGHLSAALIIAALCGFALVVYLIIASGAVDVAHAMLKIGWWLIPIALFYIVPLVFSALSWRELLPASSRPATFHIIWIRWIRESINSLLPVAGIGGDIASVRLVRLRGVPGPQAVAGTIVDITIGVATQVVCVLSGVGLLLMRSTERGALTAAWAILIGTSVLLAAIAAFIIIQHRGLFAGSARWTRRLLPEQWRSTWAAGASAIDSAVVAIYRTRRPVLRANLWHLMGWVSRAGETWLVLQALGKPLGFVDAFILESLSTGVRMAMFMVPGGLGGLEGSFVLFGALFGLPADTALAISLSKRVRELALGLPGLFAWHWIEGRYLLRRSAPTHADPS